MDLKISQKTTQLIANELSQKDPKDYKTMGELVNGITAIMSLTGIDMVKISKETEYEEKIKKLEKEIEDLKNVEPGK